RIRRLGRSTWTARERSRETRARFSFSRARGRRHVDRSCIMHAICRALCGVFAHDRGRDCDDALSRNVAVTFVRSMLVRAVFGVVVALAITPACTKPDASSAGAVPSASSAVVDSSFVADAAADSDAAVDASTSSDADAGAVEAPTGIV